MARFIQVSALTVVAACWLSAVGCSSSNDPSTSTTPAGAGSPTTSAGTGNVDPGTGGSTATPDPGAGGTVSIAGGTGTAGSSSASGGSAAAGTFMPLCSAVPMTAAGVAPTKGGACAAADTQLCYKTCGPQSSGFKSETCTNGTYLEQSGCSFPMDLDASCYKIPATTDPSCPTTAPMASTACTVPACTLCNVMGNYLDSTGASKAGYCVCPAPGASGTSKWSCASATSWPCPMGKGC